LILDKIYKADESGLYWKGLPTRTLAYEREKWASRHKSSKEHLVIMCCGNASGYHKLEFVATEKAKKPWLFTGIEASCIHIHYYNQKGA
jgi:hypothetical protein